MPSIITKPVVTNKKFLAIPQPRFPKGYISILTDSRIPNDGLAHMFNMTLEQDSIPRPRPPFNPYGEAFLGTCLGRGNFIKWVGSSSEFWEISMQVVATNEVQSLGISGTPTGGTFTLSFGGHTTTNIAYNAIASAVQSALEALSSIGTGNVVCSGGALPGTAVVITFQGALANTNVATITTNSSGLTGGTMPTASVSTTTQGGPTSYLCVRKDGGAWAIVSGSYTYSTSARVSFAQGAQLTTSDTEDQRIYIANGSDNLSYYDVGSGTVVALTGLSTPSAPTVAASGGLTGSTYNQYYRITANNAGGESAASANGHDGTTTPRDFWTTGQTITVTWSSVSGATSYNIYTSDQSGQEAYLATVNGLSFIDDGSLAVNVFKLAPNNDSSSGPVLTNIVNINNQLYGVGDINNLQYLWYSGSGQHFGDLSFNPLGGGYVGIDYGGGTIPVSVFPFHDGKGTPVPSVLTHGSSGQGKLEHIQFTSTTVGTTTLTYPNVYEASSQDGTPASRGVAIYNNNAYYCTGTAFKTTGTMPNVINILATDTISNQILPDIQNLNLSALKNIIATEYLGKIYFAVPVGDTGGNNQIWVLDLTRGGLWILYWELSTAGTIDDMYLYEDNSGNAHLCIIQNNTVLELDLDRHATPTQDNGVPFSTRLTSGAMVFDAGGVAMVSSYFTYFKFLYPQGKVNINVYGLTEDNTTDLLVSDSVDEVASRTFVLWGTLLYSNPDGSSVFSGDSGTGNNLVPPIESTASPTITVAEEVDEIVSQQSWEISTHDSGCDYLLSSVTTTAYAIPRRYAGNT